MNLTPRDAAAAAWSAERKRPPAGKFNGAGIGVQEGQPSAETDTPLVVHDAGDIEVTKIVPRQWLLGVTFCRKFISGLIAEGGGGKTAIRYSQYLAAASGRNFTGEHVHVRCRVLIVCLEDDLEEVKRRIGAAMLHHGITAQEIKGWLYFCTPKGLKLLVVDPRGVRACGVLYFELRNIIPKLQIDLVGIDPFVKAHGVEENDNNAIDEVCIMLARAADEFNCAIDVVHHTRKGAAQPGDADRSRGASSMVFAGRLMRTVTAMTAEEASIFGVANDDRTSIVRVDDAKVNLTPRSAEAMWFKLVGVSLGNTDVDPLYRHGDNVQTVERWMPPDMWRGATAAFNAILDEIDAGLPGGRLFSHVGAAKDRAAWPVVQKHLDRTEAQAREIIKTWIKNGVLTIVEFDDQQDRKTRKGLRSDPMKRPE